MAPPADPVPAFEFLTHEELWLVALIGLALVLANLWDFVRYGLDHANHPAETPHLAAHPLQAVAAVASRAVAATVFPHAGRATPRPLWRRRNVPAQVRQGHRPLKPQQG